MAIGLLPRYISKVGKQNISHRNSASALSGKLIRMHLYKFTMSNQFMFGMNKRFDQSLIIRIRLHLGASQK